MVSERRAQHDLVGFVNGKVVCSEATKMNSTDSEVNLGCLLIIRGCRIRRQPVQVD